MNKVGIDLEKIERFKLERKSQFIINNFTKSEIEYAYSKERPEQTLCGIFCAKEAVIKALEEQDILLNQIEIRLDQKGKPKVKLMNKDNKKISVSISHSGEYSTAIALVE